MKDIIRYSWIDSSSEHDQQPPAACRRLWISPKTQDNPGILITRPDGSNPLTIKGVLGIEPEEIKYRDEFSEYFGKIDDSTILITKAVADSLKVDTGDKVIFKGRTFTVGQLIDAVKVSAAKDMDTSSILPADFTETSANMPTNTDNEDEMEAMSQRNWASIPVDQVVIVSADSAKPTSTPSSSIRTASNPPSKQLKSSPESFPSRFPPPVKTASTAICSEPS